MAALEAQRKEKEETAKAAAEKRRQQQRAKHAARQQAVKDAAAANVEKVLHGCAASYLLRVLFCTCLCCGCFSVHACAHALCCAPELRLSIAGV